MSKEDKICRDCSYYFHISEYGSVGACISSKSKKNYVKYNEFCCYWDDKYAVFCAPIESRFEILDL